nr:hypothetical protein [Tanacetum cinerariifolium]
MNEHDSFGYGKRFFKPKRECEGRGVKEKKQDDDGAYSLGNGDALSSMGVVQISNTIDVGGKDSDGLNSSPTKVTPGNLAVNKDGNLHDENVGMTPSKYTANPNKGEACGVLRRIIEMDGAFGNVPVWVKPHGVSVMEFSEDGLSSIAMKDCYVRSMIELCTDVELEDTIVVPMPKLVGEGFYTCTIRVENISENLLGVRVPTANTSGNKKKGVEPNKEVSNSNPFAVLNLVVNDVEFGTNGGTLNLACNGASSSGFSFWNVETSITSTTPIVDKIGKLEKLIIYGKVTLVDDDGKTLKKVDYLGDHDSEDEVDS